MPVGLASALLMALYVVGSASSSAIAAELIMFEQPGCPFCRAFDQEIAPDYPRSAAGKIAPLRRADIFDDRRGGIPGLTPAYFTPTFVVVDDAGQEVGRLEGYPGRKYFYPEIEAIIEKLTRGKDAQAPDTAGRNAGVGVVPSGSMQGRVV